MAHLVSSIVTGTFANLIGVQRAAARTYQRTNPGAFLTAGQAANCSPAKRSAGDSQLVTMFLPERSMTSVITNSRNGSLRQCCSRHHEFESPKNQHTQ